MSQIKMTFCPEVAKKVGTDAAIILSNIEFWQATNKANKRNYHDGHYWTYNSVKAFNELFSYLTEAKIRKCLEKLEKEEFIISGNYNSSSYDRTKWYCSIRQIHLSEITNGTVRNDEPIPYNKPNDNTDDKQLPAVSENRFSEEVYRTLDKCLEYFPEHLHPKTQKNKENWLDVVDKLNRIDRIPFEAVIQITKAAREDRFWSSNFLAMTKLRQKDKDQIPYIVVFAEKFKPKEQKINRQTEQQIRNTGQTILDAFTKN